jgi:ribulose-phosphate 3-epimerase
MAIICPSVTPLTTDPHEYREQIERVASLSTRLQLDFMDGDFAPSRCLPIAQAWWPENTQADIHLMYRRPGEYLETLVSLSPSLVILHAESEGDIAGYLQHIKGFGIRVGVALLQETQPQAVADLLSIADHALIFSGKLGYFGGTVDMTMLQKVQAIRLINPAIEIGWDGGVTAENAPLLARGGVDVLNVGGAIQRAGDPAAAYATLVATISEKNL